MRRSPGLLSAVFALSALLAPDAAAQLPYDREYPTIPYATATPSDPVTRLAQRLETGDVTLEREGPSGYLASVLRELGIPVSSQMLVYSKTSLLTRLIWPETPRAIYFNDEVYVAWVPGSDGLEISAHDPGLGPVFYMLDSREGSGPQLRRQTGLCLQCHDSYSLTGGGVPRHILGSGLIDENGQLVSHEAWEVTTDETPIRRRWGGWYVTGTHGDQVHMGNLIVRDPAQIDLAAGGNVTDLSGLLDTSPYLGSHSDIVALLVAEHQVHVHNLTTLLNYRTVTAIHADEQAGLRPGEWSERTTGIVEGIGESLVRAMLFVDAPRFDDPIEGTSGFAADFARGGPTDARGRSLRDLDLDTRLFRYPLSYLIHSDAFDALPDPARAYVYRRIRQVLTGGDRRPGFAHLSEGDREAILSILEDTKPEFARAGR